MQLKSKCKPNCTREKICAVCRNWRRSFRVGQNITWGNCSYVYTIIKVTPDYLIVNTNQNGGRDNEHEVGYNQANLQKTLATPGRTYYGDEGIIPVEKK